MAVWLRIVLSGLLGYVIGSISPAWILGRLLRSIDIRDVNYQNAGTRNVKKTLGLWPAVLTAIIDTGKGIAAVLLSESLFGPLGHLMVVPAVAAVAGHIFPFYLKFRGGRGTATGVGVYLSIVARETVTGSLPWYLIIALLAAALLLYLVTRSGDATALLVFLAMAVIAPAELGFSPNGVTALAMAAYIFAHALFRGRDVGLYALPGGKVFLGWRVILRPVAMLFVPLELLIPRPWLLGLLSALAAAALAMDVFRIARKRRMQRIYREKEARQLSSITLFLLSVLLIFSLFKPTTAYVALGFLVAGDLCSKLTGMRFGRHELIAGRTLEGSVGFLLGALLAGYVLSRVFGAPPLHLVAIAAVGAAAIELLTIGLDDNLTVGVGSAGLLSLLLLI